MASIKKNHNIMFVAANKRLHAGVLANKDNIRADFGIRPGLWLSEEEDAMMDYLDEFVKYNITWTFLYDRFAIAKVPIAIGPYNKTYEGFKGYDESDVKKFLFDWLEDKKAELSSHTVIDADRILKTPSEYLEEI